MTDKLDVDAIRRDADIATDSQVIALCDEVTRLQSALAQTEAEMVRRIANYLRRCGEYALSNQVEQGLWKP